MTQKELSYIEDAISHESIMLTDCKEAINLLTDESLKNFLENEINKHEETKQNLINLLEEKSNG